MLKTSITQNEAICSLKNKASVYEIGNDIVLCVIDEEKDLNYFSTLTELIDSNFLQEVKECVLISLQPLSEFKAERKPESLIIRSIMQSKNVFNDIQALETPNFISGVSAGIATKLSMNKNFPFSCFAIFVDIFDEISIKKILTFLKRFGISYDESVKIKALHHKSDLYM